MNFPSRAKRIGTGLGRVLEYLCYLTLTVLALGPILWILSMSLKTQREFITDPFGVPPYFRLDNYIELISDKQIIVFFENSFFITFFSMLLVLSLGGLAAYAIARIPFRGHQLLFILFLIGNTVPIIAVVIPLFILVHDLGLGGTRWSIILPFVAMNMGITDGPASIG